MTTGILGNLGSGGLFGGQLGTGLQGQLIMPALTVIVTDQNDVEIVAAVTAIVGLGLAGSIDGETADDADAGHIQIAGNLRRGMVRITAESSGFVTQSVSQIHMAAETVTIKMVPA